jgi:hypothetical protein
MARYSTSWAGRLKFHSRTACYFDLTAANAPAEPGVLMDAQVSLRSNETCDDLHKLDDHVRLDDVRRHARH